MRKFGLKACLALALSAAMVLTACGATWVATMDTIIASAAPALVSILQVAAIANGTTVDPALVARINADAAAIKTLATDFAKASAAAQPAVCAQLQAAIAAYEADLPLVMKVAHVVDPNTQQKIEELSALIAGLFASIEPLIPGCQASAVAVAKRPMPLPVKTFVQDYNAIMVKPVGIPAVDAATPALQLHVRK